VTDQIILVASTLLAGILLALFTNGWPAHVGGILIVIGLFGVLDALARSVDHGQR